MIIGIDGNEANQKVRVGSGVYGFELLKQFKKFQISNRVPFGRFQIYLKDKPLSDLPLSNGDWTYKVIKPSKLWTQFRLPIELWKEKFTGNVPKVFFSPTHYAPRFCPIPSVITIFDLSFIKFPEMFLPEDLYKLKNWTKYSIRQAKKIITISQFSKKEIIDYYKIDPEKIVVAYPGYDRHRFNDRIKNQEPRTKNIKNKYKIDGEYVIFIGTIQPRKNLVRLLEAFTNLVRKANPNQVRLNLVICGMIKEGRGGWMQEKIINKIKNQKSKIKNNIILTGYIPDEDLPYLMAGARALVLPSLYEGFGIPVIEAMACGVPTVVSNSSSLPEIAGDASILVDPYDVESIAEGINDACYNNSKREVSTTRGLQQVKNYSREKSAAKILEVLNLSSRSASWRSGDLY